MARNEQRKLTATYMNGSAVALFVVGSLPVIMATNRAHEEMILSLNPAKLLLYNPVDLKMLVFSYIISLCFYICAGVSLQNLED